MQKSQKTPCIEFYTKVLSIGSHHKISPADTTVRTALHSIVNSNSLPYIHFTFWLNFRYFGQENQVEMKRTKTGTVLPISPRCGLLFWPLQFLLLCLCFGKWRKRVSEEFWGSIYTFIWFAFGKSVVQFYLDKKVKFYLMNFTWTRNCPT